MNEQELQKHAMKEALKHIVENGPNFSPQMRRDLIHIIDAGNTGEEICQAVLAYIAALRGM